MPRLIHLALLAFSSIALSSCGTQFHREWKAALLTKPQPGSIQGCWEGSWHSETTGHTGKLRCIIGPEKNQDGDREFAYWATWKRVLSSAFNADHRVKAQGSGFSFEGRHEMPGWAGGHYTYEGRIQDGEFKAAYRCAKDHGAYVMRRPRP